MSIYGLILLIAPPAVGVIVGYACGGRLGELRYIRLSALWLLWLAAAVQAAQYYVTPLRHPALLVVVFGLVLWWLARNLPTWPLAIRVAGVAITVGALANGLTIALNGRMPYEPTAAAAVGLRPDLTTPKNEPADDATRLAFLGDTIPVSPLNKVVSAGDVLIGAGTVALTALAMRRRRHDQPDPIPQLTTGGET
ncbi:DUF5317 family protein [Catellatospora citrea]|uniref:DUF5317 domain-containing protein n=1 Tax=Catellatospora citrea TaxID=53366 RepID=A0A8J3NZ95_9ACTN|nr:DUF5317 family protein [Catellatospora citrea]RKE05314.1 uncharacterized protein DUF4345 [Catellatospora citrea]GIF98245.1 hypothetical protein Cci01nite_33390 [Catellatospora citrea]